MRRISLIPGVCAAVLFSAAGAEPLPEARWLAPGANRVAALTLSPGECVSLRNNADTDYLSEIGRAAFSSPLLLGGPAARGGLSCASCHVDGRSNPNFYLEGLSGAPGTADVTSSIFSSVRDDSVFNPAPIPSLVGIGKNKSFGTRAPQPSLHAFIGSAIVEEFQGAQVPPAVLDGLVAYIAGMDAAYCPKAPSALTPRRAMDDVRRTLAAARAASAKGDEAAADFLLVSAQAALGRNHARFPGASSATLRDSLETLSGDIGSARGLMKEPQSLARALDEYSTRAKRIGKRLEKARGQSLYDPQRLRAEMGEE
ncbi:MAG: hypothetical protein A3E78_05230 [Alphaproteobacteria bacterium RIFCSPHIGHO2_12_FULL_63_12]|nr:MAG: hypothetical protein A3E78_05230 [Alphaproteobacteria bacterium RIFCSPHIGHO2_12_FULL_63_12]